MEWYVHVCSSFLQYLPLHFQVDLVKAFIPLPSRSVFKLLLHIIVETKLQVVAGYTEEIGRRWIVTSFGLNFIFLIGPKSCCPRNLQGTPFVDATDLTR